MQKITIAQCLKEKNRSNGMENRSSTMAKDQRLLQGLEVRRHQGAHHGKGPTTAHHLEPTMAHHTIGLHQHSTTIRRQHLHDKPKPKHKEPRQAPHTNRTTSKQLQNAVGEEATPPLDDDGGGRVEGASISNSFPPPKGLADDERPIGPDQLLHTGPPQWLVVSLHLRTTTQQ